MPNGELSTESLEIPATVFPGMFEREFQATIIYRGRPITVIVSPDDVVLEGAIPSDAGSAGRLRVYLVDADDKGLLIDLPGEPLGWSRRLRVPEDEFEEAFAGA